MWPRTAKSILVTAPPGLPAGSAAHPDRADQRDTLRPSTLLWNGGIGTYVKASTETHSDIGDKANDAVLVDAAQVRARVIGEGGNLGLTALGRTEYALTGGRVNSDALANSALTVTAEVFDHRPLWDEIRDTEMPTFAADQLKSEGGSSIAEPDCSNAVVQPSAGLRGRAAQPTTG